MWSVKGAQPEPRVQVAFMENEAKMPSPTGKGLGEASAEMVQSGWEEADPGVLPRAQAVGFLLSSHGLWMKVFWEPTEERETDAQK